MTTIRVFAAVACVGIAALPTLAAEPDNHPPRMGRRPPYPQTTLVCDGRAHCLIVYPAGVESFRPLAESLATSIGRLSGATVPIKPDSSVVSRRFVVAPKFRRTNLILLGNLNNNQAVFFLYANHFTRVDVAWPGKAGHVLQAICNPYGTGKNVVVAGGSDLPGVKRAVAELVQQIEKGTRGRDIVLPLLSRIVVDGRVPAWQPAGGEDEFMTFQNLVASWIETGSPAALQAVKTFLEPHIRPDSRLFSVRHYRGIGVAVALDLVDDTGILSADDLETIDNAYLNSLRGVYLAKQWPFPFGNGGGSDPHTANGALEFYFPATYLLKYGQPNAAARKLLEDSTAEMRVFLEQMVQAHHGNYRDTGWSYDLPHRCWYRYALHDERFELFDQGYAHNQWLLGVALRSLPVTTGIATFYFADPKMKYFSPGGSISGWGYSLPGGNWPTPVRLEPRRPEELLGVMHVPLDAAHYRGRDLDAGFDKICFMDDFHKEGYYLLIQGGPDVPSAVGGPVDRIRRFRYDNVDLLTSEAIINDGLRRQERTSISERLGTGRGPMVAYAQTKFPEPTGYVDRLTTTVFRRGQFFVIFDRFVFTKAGRVTASRRWTPASTPMRYGRGWAAAVGEFTARILPAEPTPTGRNAVGRVGNLSGRGAQPALRQIATAGTIRQIKRLDAKPGDTVSLQHLLFVTSPSQRRELSIVQLNNSAVLVRDQIAPGRPVMLVGVNDGGGELRFGSIATDARVFVVSAQGSELFGGTMLRVGDRPVELRRSHEALAAGQLDAMGPILTKMFDRATEGSETVAHSERELTAPESLLEELWSFDDFRKRGTIVPARVVETSDTSWLFDLGREVDLVEIDSVQAPPELTSISVGRSVEELTEVPVQRGGSLRFGLHHYGLCHMTGAASLKLDSRCRFVRLPPDQPQGLSRYPVSFVGIQFLARPLVASVGRRYPMADYFPKLPQMGQMTATRRHRVSDLDGDGTPELLAATDQYELLALSADGRLLWHRQYDHPIIDLFASDLDGDGRREVLVAHWDQHLHVLDADGHDLGQANANQFPQGATTGARFVAVWPDGEGRKRPVVGTWNRMHLPRRETDFRDPKSWLNVVDDAWPKDSGIRECIDLNGNGTPDILMHGCTGPIVVAEPRLDDAGREQLAYLGKFQSLPGQYFHCERFRLKSRPDSLAVLCIGQQGVAAVAISPAADQPQPGVHFEEEFRFTVSPVICYDRRDIDGDGFEEIAIGKPDGFVFLLGNDGRLLARAAAGDQVHAVKLLRAGSQTILAVAVDDDLALFDASLDPLARTTLGRITALDVLPGDVDETLVVFAASRWFAARLKFRRLVPKG